MPRTFLKPKPKQNQKEQKKLSCGVLVWFLVEAFEKVFWFSSLCFVLFSFILYQRSLSLFSFFVSDEKKNTFFTQTRDKNESTLLIIGGEYFFVSYYAQKRARLLGRKERGERHDE